VVDESERRKERARLLSYIVAILAKQKSQEIILTKKELEATRSLNVSIVVGERDEYHKLSLNDSNSIDLTPYKSDPTHYNPRRTRNHMR
jgi:hypothetical protein